MPFPSKLLLKEVIKRLQAYDSNFRLYEHTKIKDRWEISYEVKGDIVDAYPLKAPGGKERTYIDIQRLKVIARRFKIPAQVFKLTEKEIKNKKNW